MDNPRRGGAKFKTFSIGRVGTGLFFFNVPRTQFFMIRGTYLGNFSFFGMGGKKSDALRRRGESLRGRTILDGRSFQIPEGLNSMF